jgi:PKHD-type hydroxylase
MFLVLENLIAPDVLASIREAAGRARFADGRATAGAEARRVKDNTQATPSDPAARIALSLAKEALEADPRFRAAARPARLSPLMLSRTEPGMSYGAHIDDALMGQGTDRIRADIAFSIFLSDPETYEGGALVIEEISASREIRLPAGASILYPASTLHRVSPVTSGSRLAAVGWVQSAVRDPAQREILYDLDLAVPAMADDAARLRLRKTVSNLLRMWAEP